MALWDSVGRRFMPLAFIVAAAVLLAACGGNSVDLDQAPVRQSAQVITLDEALEQLSELAVPAGIEAAKFEALRLELQQSLLDQGRDRFVSIAPDSSLSVVTDLSVVSEGTGPLSFEWTYKSQGDYDLNSEVNIADLTPIGQHFKKSPASPDWGAGRTADGDTNNEVNIADITPIGANFARKTDGYELQESATGVGDTGWTEVAEVLFSASELVIVEGKRTFSAAHNSPSGGMFYRVVPFHGADYGAPSNVVEAPLNGIPGRPENLTATQGTVFDAVELDWDELAGAESYEVSRRVNIADPFVPIHTASASETEYIDNDVETGTRYQYVVRGVAGELFSSNSVIAEGWPLEVPLTPANLAAADGESSEFIGLTWDSVPFAEQYLIFRSTTAGGGHVQIDSTDAANYQDTTATIDSYYYYYVIASNAAGSSAASNEDRGHLDGALPEITEVTPLEGLRGLEITLSATNVGAPAVSWEWDFGGASDTATSTEESPTIMLTSLGTFQASVTAVGTVDSHTFNFELIVSDSQWVHTFGNLTSDSAGSISVDEVGNVYVLGALQYDPVFLKYGADGTLLWSKMFTASISQLGRSAKADADGNVYFCLSPNSPTTGILVGKIDTVGALQWLKQWNVPQTCIHLKTAMDSSGNFHVCGTIGLGDPEYIPLIKVDPSGTLLWQKMLSHEGGLGHDSMANDGFIVDANANCLIAGDEGRILKLDSTGNFLWEKEYGGTGHDHPYAMAVDSTGNIYLGGGTENGGTPYRSYIVKMSGDGALIWQKWYLMENGPANSPDYSIFRIDPLDNIYALTTDDTDTTVGPQLVRYDLDGNVTGHWSFNHGTTPPALYGFALDSNGYIYCSGNAPNTNTSWTAETGTEGVLAGEMNDSENSIQNAVGVMLDFPAMLTNATGTVDTGGGTDDILALKLNPDSLP